MTFKKVLALAAALLMMVSVNTFSVWAAEGDAAGEEIAEEIVKDDAGEDKTEDPSEVEAEKPSESETEESTEGETEKPSESETEEPTEGEAEKPSESETEEPSEGETEKPSESETEEPSEGEAEKPAEDEPEEEQSAIGEYSVFEAIRIRRDLLAKGNKYTLKDYKDVSTFLVNTSKLSARYFNFRYDMEDGDPKAYKNLNVFEPREVLYKSEFKLMSNHLEKDGYISMGWEYNGEVYNGGMIFKMPACDVVMKPVWVKRYTLMYTAGEYDDIVGNHSDSTILSEGANYFLADAGRFSRKGYYISGWKCLNTGDIYKPGDAFEMIAEDVEFEAVWAPASYPVTISANNAKKDKISLWAEFNTEFVFPECEFENEGKKFVGWKYNKEIYQPGDSFIVQAMLSGSKIVITAVWE